MNMKAVTFLLSFVGLSLAIPKERFYPFGISAGDTVLPPNDDDSSGQITLQSGSFPYFDEQHTTLYVNNNGDISFDGPVSTFTPESFPLQDLDLSLIAPYWADVDTRGNGTVYYRETQSIDVMQRANSDILSAFSIRFVPTFAFIATWDSVGHYNQNTDRIATFQCVLMTDGTVSYVKFLYADGEIQWTTGDASDGVNGFGGTPAQVGFDAGDGERFFSVPASQTDEIVNIASTTNIDEAGVWTFRVNGDIARCLSSEDMENTPLVITPRAGSMLGGTAVFLSSMCLEETDTITCQYEGFEPMNADLRAESDIETEARPALCVSPRFSRPGSKQLRILVVSELGVIKYDISTQFYARSIDENNEVQINGLESPLVNPQTRVSISWDPQNLIPRHVLDPNSFRINLILVVFDLHSGEWQEVYDGIDNPEQLNTGQADVTFEIISDDNQRPITDVLAVAIQVKIEIGAGRRKRVESPFQTLELVTQWTKIIYYSFSNSLQSVCEGWSEAQPENIGEIILEEVTPCAPRVAQARSPNSGLVEDTGISRILSNNLFHEGTDTCFRSETPSPSGYGQQCCYDSNGFLMVGNPGGSVDKVSPSRSMFRHIEEDVIPFIFCCHGAPVVSIPGQSMDDPCTLYYYSKRPSHDGQGFNPLPPACVYGDPHIVTLDGFKYTFNGRGEYLLVQVDDEFTFQGRMIQPSLPAGNTVDATVFSAIAMREGNNTVQFQVGPFADDPDALINSEFIDFTDVAAQDFNGVVVTKADNTLSASFASGAYIEVREENGFFSTLLVSLPESWQGLTEGLMGNYNGNTSDDLTPQTGDPLPLDSDLRTIHESFGVTWIISDQQDSIFSYPDGENISNYYFPDFEPAFDVTFSDPALEQAANDICGDDIFCRFDIATTESTTIGLSTLIGGQEFDQIVNNSQPTVCHPPCVNGACVLTDVCSCSVGYTGPQCDTAITTECEVNLCQNGGTCSNVTGSFNCSCPPGFTGISCETEEMFQSGFGSGSGSGLDPMVDPANCSERCRSVQCWVEGEFAEPGQSVANVIGTELKCTISFPNDAIDRAAIDPSFTAEYLAPGSLCFLKSLGVNLSTGNEVCTVPNGLLNIDGNIKVQSLEITYVDNDGYFRSTQPPQMLSISSSGEIIDQIYPNFENLESDNRCSLLNLQQWLMSPSLASLSSFECSRMGRIFFTVECVNWFG